MASREDVEALEALVPWDRASFQAGLASLTLSVEDASRAFARDMCTLSQLAAEVPRCSQDEIGGTPWTSFRQEVAVARKISGQAAAAELRTAIRLTAAMPRTLHLLETGRITVARARAFVHELEVLDDGLAEAIDGDLADRVTTLAPWRIRQEVRRAVLALDPDAGAVRTAVATAQRDVALEPLSDGQACVTVVGPAVPLTRWFATLDARCRALRQAGDPRTLAALRFDVATSTFPCSSHAPAEHGSALAPSPTPTPFAAAPAGLRTSGVEAAPVDCRMSRPVQAVVLVPVETALGLSNEPAWLDGYGWIAAPTCRLLLPDAELRQLCTDGPTGQVVDLAPREVRPPPTPAGVRGALVTMVTTSTELSDTAWRTEPEHDPSGPLRAFAVLRDRTCDGPTQPRSRAATCDLDHDLPHPHGPTAAWNLACRSRRTHQLKHYGWTPVRGPSGTRWTSPAGQVVHVRSSSRPSPGIDTDHTRRPAALPDADHLATVDAAQLTPVDPDDQRPLLAPERQGRAAERTTQDDDAPPW